jgi:hypothetical protein
VGVTRFQQEGTLSASGFDMHNNECRCSDAVNWRTQQRTHAQVLNSLAGVVLYGTLAVVTC